MMGKDLRIVRAGVPLASAKKVLILVHGRGATAESILPLGQAMPMAEYALLAPQAPGYAWYPQSFLALPSQNQPYLNESLTHIQAVHQEVILAGIPSERIYWLGFSQGACLSLEYITRHAQRWGGVAAFTGGLIGDALYRENYSGAFEATPVFIGTSDPDPHVPVERVYATAKVLQEMGANVLVQTYPGMPHTVSEDELLLAQKHVFGI